MRELREPVFVYGANVRRAEQDMNDILRSLRPLVSSDLIPPDHILECRKDCALTFLQEGLLPLIRDVANPTVNDVLEIAVDTMNRFKLEHPYDFDLDDPNSVITMAQVQLFPIEIVYAHKINKSEEDEKILKLIVQAGDLLERVTDESASDNKDDNK